MKRCTKCQRNRQPSEFYKHPRTADGLQSWCKHCQRFERDPQAKTYDDLETARCRICQRRKYLKDFYCSRRPDGSIYKVPSYCKKCDNQRRRG